MEQWKVVPGTDNVYWASDLGRIKRVGKLGHTGRLLQEKILRQTPNGTGHLQVGINGRLWTVHKLVYLAWHGLIPEGKVVRHLDDMPAHNFPSNLALGSQVDNAQDSAKNGLGFGRTLSTSTVDSILSWLAANPTASYADMREFAASAQVSQKTVVRYRDKVRRVLI